MNNAFSSWEAEKIIAYDETGLDLLGYPSIISSQGELIVVFQDGFPPTRWVSRSIDSGTTWSNPIRPFPHTGGYGFAFLMKDSDETIHMVLGNRLQNPEISGMWYSRLLGTLWSPLEPIISARHSPEFDPTAPQAVISQGNLATIRRQNRTLGHALRALTREKRQSRKRR